MTEASRIPAPNINGRIRRKIPTFSRPSITITKVGPDGTPAKPRTWRTADVTDISAGDILPDFGIVTSVHETHHLPSTTRHAPALDPDEPEWTVTIIGATIRTYHGSDKVFAFTAPAD